MIVRSLEDLKKQGRYREKPGVWNSARFLLRDDNMGFSMTRTTVAAGSKQTLEYKNHLEANLILAGEGRLTDCATGETYLLAPGVMYALDKNDRHTLEAVSELSIVCVFIPALVGEETHDAEGSYPLL